MLLSKKLCRCNICIVHTYVQFIIIICMKIDNDKTFCISRFQFLKIKLGKIPKTIYQIVKYIHYYFFLQIAVTAMRKNPVYAIYYNNWARLFILGIIPAAMLIYLNYKVRNTCHTSP